MCYKCAKLLNSRVITGQLFGAGHCDWIQGVTVLDPSLVTAGLVSTFLSILIPQSHLI